MKFASYYYASVLSTLLLVYYAYYSQKQFYPTLVYLVSSKPAYLIAGNMLLANGLVLSRIFKNIYFGQLRDVEIELLIEKGKYIFIETCFALTIFRNELTSSVMAFFVFLILIKLLHKLSKCRLEYLEQIMPVSTLMQWRVGFLLFSLITLDLFATYFSLNYILKNGRSVLILFGFEFGLQLVYAVGLTVRFGIQIVDGMLANGLRSRGLYLMLTDLVCEAIKLATYIAFFCLVFVYYGMPIHIMRDVYAAYLSFYRKLLSFIKFLRLTRNLDSRFVDATADELVAAGSCLVCREEMAAGKKLPCGHVFHLDCLRSWLQHQQACPLCRADIPVVAATPVVPPAEAIAVAAAPATPAAAPRPQDIHTVAPSTPNPGTPAATAALSSEDVAPVEETAQVAEFPSFFVVTAEPNIAVLSDPSKAGSEFRRINKGTIVFVTMRVVEMNGTQWLRVADGWMLEKLILCGSCNVPTASNTEFCCHEDVYLRPLFEMQQKEYIPRSPVTHGVVTTTSSSSSSSGACGVDVSGTRSVDTTFEFERPAQAGVYSRLHAAQRYTLSSSTGSSNNADKEFSEPHRIVPFSAELDSQDEIAELSGRINEHLSGMQTLQGASQAIAAHTSSVDLNATLVRQPGAERFQNMLQLQNQMAEITNKLVELNRSVLACQQNISQIIRDEMGSTSKTEPK